MPDHARHRPRRRREQPHAQPRHGPSEGRPRRRADGSLSSWPRSPWPGRRGPGGPVGPCASPGRGQTEALPSPGAGARPRPLQPGSVRVVPADGRQPARDGLPRRRPRRDRPRRHRDDGRGPDDLRSRRDPAGRAGHHEAPAGQGLRGGRLANTALVGGPAHVGRRLRGRPHREGRPRRRGRPGHLRQPGPGFGPGGDLLRLRGQP